MVKFNVICMRFNKINIIFLVVFILLSCESDKYFSYLPPVKILNNGIAYKYYVHTISKEGYHTKTDIEYRYIKSVNDSFILEERYNSAFKLLSKHKYLWIEDIVKELDNEVLFLNDTITSIINKPDYLTFKRGTVLYSVTTQFNTDYSRTINQNAIVLNDTTINSKSGIVVERKREIINRGNDVSENPINVSVKEIFVEGIGLWSYTFEDVKNNYYLELVEQINSKKFKELSNHLIKRVGYIDFEQTIDRNSDFQICNERYLIRDYYNGEYDKSEFIGGKNNLKQYINNRLDKSKLKKESGYLTFRFVINCVGKAGKFVTNEADFNYSEKKFNQETTNHLFYILSNIKKWSPCIVEGEAQDSYCYITFILKDGEIEDILP